MSYTKFRNLQVKDLQTLGNTVLGDASTDTLTVTARVASSVVPSTTNTRDLGSSSLKWKDLYVAGTITGDLTGNVTGNLTGNVTGNCSGTAGALASGAVFTASSTGTGSVQNIAHGFGSVPRVAFALPLDGGTPFPIVFGSHDSTNLKYTFPSGISYFAVAFK